MDISNLNTVDACNAGVEIELKNPSTGGGLGVFITVVGYESNEVRKLRSEALAKMAARQLKGDAFDIDEHQEREREHSIELACRATISWRELEWNGKPLECNESNKRMVFGKEGFEWIAKQVDDAVGNLKLFMQSAPKV